MCLLIILKHFFFEIPNEYAMDLLTNKHCKLVKDIIQPGNVTVSLILPI